MQASPPQISGDFVIPVVMVGIWGPLPSTTTVSIWSLNHRVKVSMDALAARHPVLLPCRHAEARPDRPGTPDPPARRRVHRRLDGWDTAPDHDGKFRGDLGGHDAA